MDVLKSLQLISNSNLTSKEEALLAKSWHLISFYQSGDIASSLNNVRVFVSGILGLSEKWMFKTRLATSNKQQESPTEILTRCNNVTNFHQKCEDEVDNDFKVFKFANKTQVKEIQNEYMQLKLRKLENEINSSKNRLFTHSKSIDPKTIQNVETPKFPEILIEHNENLENQINQLDSKIEIKDSPDHIEESKAVGFSSNDQFKHSLSQKLRKAHHNKILSIDKCEPPALELDVYISENHMEKLIVYKDDSPEIVAHEFCVKHCLGIEKKDLLLNVIKEQVSKVLTCISEEDENNE